MKYTLSLILFSVITVLVSCQGKQTTKSNENTSDTATVIQQDLASADPAETNQQKEEQPERKESAEIPQKQETTKQDEAVKMIIIDTNREPASANKTYRIKSFSVERNILSIEVSYLGGCGKHNFGLYSNGLLKKSLPPQIDVNLEHVKENETCSESMKQTLFFDLSPLNRQGNDLIILNVDNEKNRLDWKN